MVVRRLIDFRQTRPRKGQLRCRCGNSFTPRVHDGVIQTMCDPCTLTYRAEEAKRRFPPWRPR